MVKKEGSATENAPSPQGQCLVLKGASIRGAEAVLGRVAAGYGQGQYGRRDPIMKSCEVEDLRAGTVEGAASGGWREGGWHDVISEQVWVRNNRILNVSNFSITFSITFTYNFCQALVCIFQ